RQPIVFALRKPILDPQVVPLDIACLRQAESDCRSVGGSCCLQERAKKSDYRHRRLLRGCRERPRRRTAEYCDELAALHLITSSCFGVGMTRLINEQNIRTPQRIENRACNDPGILATDMKPISCGLPCMRVMCFEYSIRN